MLRNALLRHPLTTGAVIGTVPGLAIAYYLYTHIAWYQQMINWQFQNPWILLPAAAVGAAIAIVTDRD